MTFIPSVGRTSMTVTIIKLCHNSALKSGNHRAVGSWRERDKERPGRAIINDAPHCRCFIENPVSRLNDHECTCHALSRVAIEFFLEPWIFFLTVKRHRSPPGSVLRCDSFFFPFFSFFFFEFVGIAPYLKWHYSHWRKETF